MNALVGVIVLEQGLQCWHCNEQADQLGHDKHRDVGRVNASERIGKAAGNCDCRVCKAG